MQPRRQMPSRVKSSRQPNASDHDSATQVIYDCNLFKKAEATFIPGNKNHSNSLNRRIVLHTCTVKINNSREKKGEEKEQEKEEWTIHRYQQEGHPRTRKRIEQEQETASALRFVLISKSQWEISFFFPFPFSPSITEE